VGTMSILFGNTQIPCTPSRFRVIHFPQTNPTIWYLVIEDFALIIFWLYRNHERYPCVVYPLIPLYTYTIGTMLCIVVSRAIQIFNFSTRDTDQYTIWKSFITLNSEVIMYCQCCHLINIFFQVLMVIWNAV